MGGATRASAEGARARIDRVAPLPAARRRYPTGPDPLPPRSGVGLQRLLAAISTTAGNRAVNQVLGPRRPAPPDYRGAAAGPARGCHSAGHRRPGRDHRRDGPDRIRELIGLGPAADLGWPDRGGGCRADPRAAAGAGSDPGRAHPCDHQGAEPGAPRDAPECPALQHGPHADGRPGGRRQRRRRCRSRARRGLHQELGGRRRADRARLRRRCEPARRLRPDGSGDRR